MCEIVLVARFVHFSLVVGHTSRASQYVWIDGDWAWKSTAEPNKSVKGTHRPLAVLKFHFFSRFGGFVKAQWIARPLTLR